MMNDQQLESPVYLQRMAKPSVEHPPTLYAMTVPSRTNISAYVRLFVIGIGKPLSPELFEITHQVADVARITLKEHSGRDWLYVKGIGVAAQAAEDVAASLAMKLGIVDAGLARSAYHVYAL